MQNQNKTYYFLENNILKNFEMKKDINFDILWGTIHYSKLNPCKVCDKFHVCPIPLHANPLYSSTHLSTSSPYPPPQPTLYTSISITQSSLPLFPLRHLSSFPSTPSIFSPSSSSPSSSSTSLHFVLM